MKEINSYICIASCSGIRKTKLYIKYWLNHSIEILPRKHIVLTSFEIKSNIQVTQKCIIGKIRLFHADGAEVSTRPTESRLFRPNDEFEDMHAITQSLQVGISF